MAHNPPRRIEGSNPSPATISTDTFTISKVDPERRPYATVSNGLPTTRLEYNRIVRGSLFALIGVAFPRQKPFQVSILPGNQGVHPHIITIYQRSEPQNRYTKFGSMGSSVPNMRLLGICQVPFPACFMTFAIHS